MNICKIFQGDYPWDVRVEKIAKVLSHIGHEVHLICRNTRQEIYDEEIDGFYVHRLPNPFHRFNKLDNLLSTPWFFNPLWISHVRRIVRKHNINVLLVRDLPLALTTILVSKLDGIPVVFDMAENYPAAMADWRRWEKGLEKLKNSVVRNIWTAKQVEDVSLKQIDHVIVVAEESKERLIQKGIFPNKISIVGNTPDLEIFSSSRSPDNDLVRRFKQEFVILYIGEILIHRGLDIAIKAMPDILKNIPNARLLLVGKGKDQEENSLKEIVSDLQLREHVIFEGWVNFLKLPDYIQVSSVCIVPHYKTEHINTTLPNKLFDYMALSKPVIVSDSPPLKRVVEEEECGISFISGNPSEFAKAVVKLKDEEVRKRLGLQGQKAIRQKYNWAKDSAVIKKIFDSINYS